MSDDTFDDDDSLSKSSSSSGDNSQISVYGRIRPSTKNDSTVCLLAPSHQSIEFRLPITRETSNFINNKREQYDFKMTNIFDEKATQEDIFNGIGKPVVENVLEGFNGTIFAYGQTGSGKTYSITGGSERYEDRGLIPRALSMIFAEKEARAAQFTYTISVSYLEIYNDDGYDLLDAEHETKALTELPKVAMFEDDTGNIHMRNIHLLPANSVDEALNLLFVGDTNRIICETPSNDASSRSHCIFTIYVESREVGGSRIRRSKLHLVDLAGSERVKKTQIQGKILVEALHINLALHYLEQVIVALHKRQKDKNIHVPYRNSMMTSVLRDSLGGNCKTVMIATMSAQKGHIDESISTCRFAARVAMVRNAAVVNEELDPKLVIKKLKMHVRELKEEIAVLKGGTGASNDRELNEDETQACRQLVSSYLGSDNPVIESGLHNKYKVEACFKEFKEMIRLAREAGGGGGGSGDGGGTGRGDEENNWKQGKSSSASTNNKSSTSTTTFSPATDAELKKLRLMVSSRDNEISILVSMLKRTAHGNDIEILEDVRERAAKQARKDTGIEDVRLSNMQASPIQQALLISKGVQQLDKIHAQNHARNREVGATKEEDSQVLEQRLQAFEEFRRSYRKNELIEEQKDSLKQKIELAQKLGESINKCRNDINHTKGVIEMKRVQKGVQQLSNGGDSDESKSSLPDTPEELALKQQIETSKLSYRTSFNELKSLKTEIEQLKLLIDRSRRKLQADFDVWWTQQQAGGQQGNGKGGGGQTSSGSTTTAAPTTNFNSTGAFHVQHAASASVTATSAASFPSSRPPPMSLINHAASGYHSSGSISSQPSSSRSNSSAPTTSSSSNSSNALHAMRGGSSGSLQSAPMHQSYMTGSNPPAATTPSTTQRLASTGNAQADADIQHFYAMRDSLLKQQQQTQAMQRR